MVLVSKQATKRVLLVDDDSEVVEAVSNGLRKRGYRVNTFTDPNQALSSFRPGAYEIALLDVRMGPIDGMELYHRLKGLDRDLAVVFLTAYADVIENKPDHLQFLQKPVSLSDLAKALEDIETEG